jgi:hypothetical protein
MNQMTVYAAQARARKEAFRSALLNTCVRGAREKVPGLTLGNCLLNREFRLAAAMHLRGSFFLPPIEFSMQEARIDLIIELEAMG